MQSKWDVPKQDLKHDYSLYIAMAKIAKTFVGWVNAEAQCSTCYSALF